MKFTALAQFLLLSLFRNPCMTNAVDVDRQLQSSGQFCNISAEVSCEITGTGRDCKSLGVQPFGTCGPRLLTYKYKYCNLLQGQNITPLTYNANGDKGTVAMYRQVWGKPFLLLGLMAPGICREAVVTEEVDTCKKRVVGELKFEGW